MEQDLAFALSWAILLINTVQSNNGQLRPMRGTNLHGGYFNMGTHENNYKTHNKAFTRVV